MHSSRIFSKHSKYCQDKATLQNRLHGKPQKTTVQSLLSQLSKIFEFSVKKLENFREKHDVLNSKQNSVQKRRSTVNALIDLTKTIQAKISKSEKNCTVLNLSKAFDTVNHAILLNKT